MHIWSAYAAVRCSYVNDILMCFTNNLCFAQICSPPQTPWKKQRPKTSVQLPGPTRKWWDLLTNCATAYSSNVRSELQLYRNASFGGTVHSELSAPSSATHTIVI